MAANIGFVLRYTLNLDDYSSQLVPMVQYDLGDRWQVFVVAFHNFGSRDSEFMSLADYAYQFGAELSL
jgi:hypothetical protein